MNDFGFYGDNNEEYPYQDNQLPNNQFQGNQYPNNQFQGNQYPNNQFQGNQFPNNQMPQNNKKTRRIRSNQWLTIISFVFIALIIVESAAFIAIQLMLKNSEYAGLIGLAVVVVALLAVGGSVYCYRNTSINLRKVDLFVLIISELLFGAADYLLYVNNQPLYLYAIAAAAFVLILYILIFIKGEIKQKAILSLVTVVIAASAFILSINNSVFTVRYVYLAADGYYDDITKNDMMHFYNTAPVFTKNYTKCHSDGIYSMNEYNAFCNSYKGNLNMSELLNFSRSYDDDFFTKNCLYVASVELDSPADRIYFDETKYMLGTQKPAVKYVEAEKGRDVDGICIMLIEIPLKDDEKLNELVEFETDEVIVSKQK